MSIVRCRKRKFSYTQALAIRLAMRLETYFVCSDTYRSRERDFGLRPNSRLREFGDVQTWLILPVAMPAGVGLGVGAGAGVGEGEGWW